MKVNFHGETIFNVNRFRIEPERCQIETRCSKVERTDGETSDISCSDFENDGLVTLGKLKLVSTAEDYTSKRFEPGNYIVTLTGTATASKDQRTDETTIALQVLDPCSPPAKFSVKEQRKLSHKYRLADSPNTVTVTSDDFIVEPSFCPISVYYNGVSTTLKSGETAIEFTSENSMSVFWDKDRSPLGQTQKVSYLGVSGSVWGDVNNYWSDADEDEKENAYKDVEISFSDPCGIPEFMTFQATPQTSPASDNYSGTDIVFHYNEYIVTPELCPYTVTCDRVTKNVGSNDPVTAFGCAELDINHEARWSFVPEDLLKGVEAGTYSVWYNVSAGANPALNSRFEVRITLTTDGVVDNFPAIRDILGRLDALEEQDRVWQAQIDEM